MNGASFTFKNVIQPRLSVPLTSAQAWNLSSNSDWSAHLSADDIGFEHSASPPLLYANAYDPVNGQVIGLASAEINTKSLKIYS